VIALLFMQSALSGDHAYGSDLHCEPIPIGIPLTLGSFAEAQALLWRIHSPEGRQSAILGTMHVADARVTRAIEPIGTELARSRSFALEVLLDETAADKFGRAMHFADSRRLNTQIDFELFRRALDLLERHGIPASVAATMKPWAAFVMLSQPPGGPGQPLDLMLLTAAQADGKQISALETVDEQIAVFESLPMDQQIDMLREVVCHYDVLQSEMEVMFELYAARDLGGLMRASLAHIDAARSPFLEILLWSRNRRMVERMVPLLTAGESFIAIGAMHLVGDRGVLRLLEQRGFRVGAIY
jgi:uncharacterized protein